MNRQVPHVLLVASVVLLAGCVGGLSGTPTTDAGTAETPSTTTADDGGTVAFYVSDEENAIDDFRHLNVTVTKVGFERTAADGGGWVERDVDDETVDLTELQGANATLLDEYDVPNGTYGKVFVHVGAVNATLENGENVRVKLPSEKLHVNQEFTVEDGSEVEFVFDIAVHEAGNSGKYILRPVVSESGTDVPIDPVDEDRDERDDGQEDDDREDGDREDDQGEDEPRDDQDDERRDDEREDELNATFVGDVSQGENATIEVTRNGTPVPNATVAVDDETVGTTDADGRITVEVPRDDDLEVEVTKGDAEAELEVEFESEREDEGNGNDETGGG